MSWFAPRCRLCRKRRAEVRKLIQAGRKALICDRCAALVLAALRPIVAQARRVNHHGCAWRLLRRLRQPRDGEHLLLADSLMRDDLAAEALEVLAASGLSATAPLESAWSEGIRVRCETSLPSFAPASAALLESALSKAFEQLTADTESTELRWVQSLLYEARATLHLVTGKASEAARDIARARILGPTLPEAWRLYVEAESQLRSANPDAARELLGRAASLSGPFARRARQRLESLTAPYRGNQ